jgi:polysaccharide export outer membrane protein
MTKKIIGLVGILLVLNACASRDKMRYYKGIETEVNAEGVNYNPVLKQDDLLSIIVSSPSAEASANFNLMSFRQITGGETANTTAAPQGYLSYLIDNQGKIDFPVLGQLQLGGLTRNAAKSMIKTRLKDYINDPFVTLRILNYKVSVQGEVVRPGVFPVATDRITLPEALAMAGDLTIFGKRDNILIIRENEGKKTYNFVDITNANFINSPFYYLTQNDLVYVEPNKVRMNNAKIGPNIQVIIASLSLVVAFFAIYTTRN